MSRTSLPPLPQPENKPLLRPVPKSKICSQCGEDKGPESFYRDQRAQDGLYSSCKRCHIQIQTQSRGGKERRVLLDTERAIKRREYMRRKRLTDRYATQPFSVCEHCGVDILLYGLQVVVHNDGDMLCKPERKLMVKPREQDLDALPREIRDRIPL